MGEAPRDAWPVGFDRAIRLEFYGAKVSSDARLFPYRDLDEAVQLTKCPDRVSRPPPEGQDLPRHRRFRSVASECNLGFPGGALHSLSESSTVEPGEDQMGNVGQEVLMKPPLCVWIALLLVGCQSAPTDPRPVVIMQPHEGDHLWSFHESKHELGSGGELQIFIDPETHPEATASFAKYTLGVGGALPVHRHDKTEEFAYILSGEGAVVVVDDDGEEVEVPISAGYVWYNPPGAWHAVRNTGSTPLSLVFTTIPNEKKGLLSLFRRISVEPGREPVVLAPEDFERIASEHDLILRSSDHR